MLAAVLARVTMAWRTDGDSKLNGERARGDDEESDIS